MSPLTSFPVFESLLSPDNAAWLGRHGLAFWAVASLLATTLTALAWRQRRRLRRRQLFWIAVLPAALLFSLLAFLIKTGQRLPAFDQALTASLVQNTSVDAVAWFALPTWLGNPAPVTVLAVLLALWLGWRRQRGLAGIWLLAVIGNTLLNWGLKQVFARPRPTQWNALIHESGYSFPSGHASGVLVTYGALAYLMLRLSPSRWHLPMLLATAVLVTTAPMSRVFLQVHYASDVLAGLCSGAIWLTLCLTLAERRRRG